MIEYVKNLIPRIKQYSESIDKIEYFVDKPWVFLDEKNNKHRYIFERDGQLLFSLNGTGHEGSWKYLNHSNSIWITVNKEKFILSQGFIIEGVMILIRDGVVDEPYIFLDQNVIPDLNLVKYLNTYLEEDHIPTIKVNKENKKELKNFEEEWHKELYFIGLFLLIIIILIYFGNNNL